MGNKLFNHNNDALSKKEIYALLGDFFSLESLFVLKTVNSTNNYCKLLAEKSAPHETIVVADKQTEGRGRLGREFFSPEGTGIYMSILLKPDKISINPSLLTIAAGVAVCRTLKNLCKCPPKIKWVNDIFVNHKKVCGILAESVINSKSNQPEYIIVGIGLNVSTPSAVFPGKLKDVATSVFPESATRNQLISNILNEFYNIYMFESEKALIDEYKGYSLILNQKISFTKNNKVCLGTAIDINMGGNLVVTLENGQTMILHSGEISLGSENFAD